MFSVNLSVNVYTQHLLPASCVTRVRISHRMHVCNSSDSTMAHYIVVLTLKCLHLWGNVRLLWSKMHLMSVSSYKLTYQVTDNWALAIYSRRHQTMFLHLLFSVTFTSHKVFIVFKRHAINMRIIPPTLKACQPPQPQLIWCEW